MERKFLIPLLNDTTISPGSSGVSTPIGEPAGFDISPSSVAITLHEPGLTADNLGLKTWASSYMLSKRLAELAPILPSGARALELGAGTGLVGLAAAAVLGVDVLLTDLPEIVPNLARNIEANRHLGVEVEARVLDWREGPEEVVREEDKFGIVLVADPLYSAEHPKLLVGMVGKWLAGGREARCVVEMPLRKGYEREREDFRVRMGKRGLGVVVEGTEMGRDDWGDNGGDVECWWSVWGWAGME